MTFALTFDSYGQKSTIKVRKDLKIQGTWECYTSLADTINPDGVQLWQHFDSSNVSTMLVPSFGLPVEKAGIVSTDKYKFRNDTLTVYGKENTDVTIVTFLNRNLIKIRSIDEKEKTVLYLKRTKKK